MAIKNPNGYGSVKKLRGNRRRPYAAVVTVRCDSGAKDISFLEEALGEELYAEVLEKYHAYIKKKETARQVKKYIGYYATRQEAMMALAEYNRNPFDVDKRNTTFGEIYEILYKEKFSKMKKQAKSTYTSSIAKCESIKNTRMTELRKNHMQRIMEEYAYQSKSTQSNMLALFHAVYKFAIENDIIEKDYSQYVTVVSQREVEAKKPFTREEVETLWQNVDNDKYPMIDAILIMLYTGVRIGELFSIKKEDIHLEERYITLRGTKTKAAERYIPIHKKIVQIIAQRLAGPGGEYLFGGRGGGKMSYTSFREDNFDKIMDDLGMRHKPHECRHSFVSYATACDLNRTLLKKIVGHSTPDVTDQTYTHAFVQDLLREIDKFEI